LERLLPSSRTVAKQWAGKSHVDEVDSSLRCFSSRKQENCFYFEDYEATLWKKRLTAVMSSPPKEKTETKAGHLPAGNVTVMLLAIVVFLLGGLMLVDHSDKFVPFFI